MTRYLLVVIIIVLLVVVEVEVVVVIMMIVTIIGIVVRTYNPRHKSRFFVKLSDVSTPCDGGAFGS
jgi:hypothetical protein